MRYELIVGNIGAVLRTDNGAEARIQYGQWKALTLQPGRRCSGESVTLFCDGDVLFEHIGTERESCE